MHSILRDHEFEWLCQSYLPSRVTKVVYLLDMSAMGAWTEKMYNTIIRLKKPYVKLFSWIIVLWCAGRASFI